MAVNSVDNFVTVFRQNSFHFSFNMFSTFFSFDRQHLGYFINHLLKPSSNTFLLKTSMQVSILFHC